MRVSRLLFERADASADKKKAPQKPVLGWREWVYLPAFGNPLVKAKIDTGARSSSIHAENIRIIHTGNRDVVAFQIRPDQHLTCRIVNCEAKLLETRLVRNSGGVAEERPFVLTEIRLGDSIFAIELSLTARRNMGFRMLLGRAAIRGRYLVDPGQSFLCGQADGRMAIEDNGGNGDDEDEIEKGY